MKKMYYFEWNIYILEAALHPVAKQGASTTWRKKEMEKTVVGLRRPPFLNVQVLGRTAWL